MIVNITIGFRGPGEVSDVIKYNDAMIIKIIKNRDENIKYEIYKEGKNSWIKCFEHTIHRNDIKFNADIFSSQLSSVYYSRQIIVTNFSKFINKEDMTKMVGMLQTAIDKMRYGVESNTIRWVGQQIRREWKDLLPYVAEMLDQRG